MKEKIILTLYSQKFPEKMLKRSEDMYSYFGKKGIILCRGFICDFDVEKMIFDKALFFENGKWLWKKNIIPNEVYDRSLFIRKTKEMIKRKIIENNYIFYNSLRLSELMSNKWSTCKKFTTYSPETILIRSRKDEIKINKLKSKKIILKPLFGYGGKGIQICNKQDFKSIKYPFIAQEVIIAKKGIDNIAQGQYDLRVMLADKKIIHSFVRIPKKGEMIANLSRGAVIKLIEVDNLPEKVIEITRNISNILKDKAKKLYAIDFMIADNGKPYIIEMNSRPGIILEKEELSIRKQYYNNLINFFKK